MNNTHVYLTISINSPRKYLSFQSQLATKNFPYIFLCCGSGHVGVSLLGIHVLILFTVDISLPPFSAVDLFEEKLVACVILECIYEKKYFSMAFV